MGFRGVAQGFRGTARWGFEARGVYSSLFPYIHIYKKLPFSADFTKNWVHSIKNSDVIREPVIYVLADFVR